MTETGDRVEDAISPAQRGDDALFESWLNSTDRARARLRLFRWAIPGLALVITGYFVIFFGNRLFDTSTPRFLIGVPLFLIGTWLYLQGFLSYRSARIQWQDQQEGKARDAVNRAITQLEDTSMELPALYRLNRNELEEYHVLTKGQASSAYVNSQVAMAVGLIVLIVGGALALTVDDTSSKVVTAVLTALGGALAGYVGRTFIHTYERTLLQLNLFFQQPVVSSYILTAERLVLKMSAAQRDAAYNRLVDKLLEAATARVAPVETAGTRRSRTRQQPQDD